MKRILVTQRLVREPRTGEVRDCLDVRWGAFLEAAGFLAVPFPSGFSAGAFLREIPCDGLLLTGGNDLDSAVPDVLSARRDEVEKDLLARFLDQGLPIVGVCRGMQLVAESFGMSIAPVSGHVGTRMAVRPEPSSRFRDLMGQLADVNSFHDYAVARVQAPFVLSAASADGTAEAMECIQHQVFCQMWHSERETPFVPADLDIFRRAFSA